MILVGGGHVDPGQATEPGQDSEVLSLFLIDQTLHPVGLSGQLLAVLDQIIHVAQQLLLLVGFLLELGLGVLKLAREVVQLLLGAEDCRVQILAPSRSSPRSILPSYRLRRLSSSAFLNLRSVSRARSLPAAP